MGVGQVARYNQRHNYPAHGRSPTLEQRDIPLASRCVKAGAEVIAGWTNTTLLFVVLARRKLFLLDERTRYAGSRILLDGSVRRR